MKLSEPISCKGIKKIKVRYTNEIPICAFCDTGTRRAFVRRWVESAFHPPIYSEAGYLENAQSAILVYTWLCLDCNSDYMIIGNSLRGYKYM